MTTPAADTTWAATARAAHAATRPLARSRQAPSSLRASAACSATRPLARARQAPLSSSRARAARPTTRPLTRSRQAPMSLRASAAGLATRPLTSSRRAACARPATHPPVRSRLAPPSSRSQADRPAARPLALSRRASPSSKVRTTQSATWRRRALGRRQCAQGHAPLARRCGHQRALGRRRTSSRATPAPTMLAVPSRLSGARRQRIRRGPVSNVSSSSSSRRMELTRRGAYSLARAPRRRR